MKKVSALVLLGFALGACSMSSKNAVSGKVCKDSSGNSVNASEIFGQWKKVSGYLDPNKATDPATLALDYNLLLVEKGTANSICQFEVKNGAAQAILSSNPETFVANYSHNIAAKTLDLTYTFGAANSTASSPKHDFAQYSINADDCTNITLTLDYPNNASLSPEVFKLQTKNVPAGSCNPKP